MFILLEHSQAEFEFLGQCKINFMAKDYKISFNISGEE